MALLRSDILNKDFIEKVLQKFEGTSRVNVLSLEVGRCDQKGSLLEERKAVGVEAVVKGRSKQYEWVAKVLRPEAGPSNYARFQGILETEVNFYNSLLPELLHLGAPLPKTFPILWGDSTTLSKEVLLLESPSPLGFRSAIHLQKTGLDLGHVILVVEWLARFHAYCHVAIRRFMDSGKGSLDDWLRVHPWIRKSNEEGVHYNHMAEEINEKDFSNINLRKKLMSMVATCLKSEADGNHKKLDSLLERQDWLDNLRKETMSENVKRETDFVSVCHGEAWLGSFYFKYSNTVEDDSSQEQDRDINVPCPVEVVGSDFQSCSFGRPGIDLAHFLLTSTTREFRKNHLETVMQIYLQELDDVIISQGYPSGIYTANDLRSDYRRGLVIGITFCLFAMPMLTSNNHDEVDGTRSSLRDEDIPEMDQLSYGPTIQKRLVDGLLDIVDSI